MAGTTCWASRLPMLTSSGTSYSGWFSRRRARSGSSSGATSATASSTTYPVTGAGAKHDDGMKGAECPSAFTNLTRNYTIQTQPPTSSANRSTHTQFIRPRLGVLQSTTRPPEPHVWNTFNAQHPKVGSEGGSSRIVLFLPKDNPQVQKQESSRHAKKEW